MLERLGCRPRWGTPGVFGLMAREGSAADIANCADLQESLQLPHVEECRSIWPEMWRTLLSNGNMQLLLVESRSRRVGARVVSFSATVFATDEFCAEAQSTLPPFLGVEMTRRYLADELPVLNREQIARANAGDGLNVIICFGGWEDHGLSREEMVAIREKQAEAFYLAHSGYRLKEFLADPMGEDALQWMLGAGARLRRDYSRYFQKHRVRTTGSSQRPRLVGLTKEEALTNPGSHLSSFFVYTPPRFHFNRSEQILLQHALMGETSEELATSLFISPWTVKKRWRAIYERVADVDRELLGPQIANSLGTTSRGAERRRHLLQYLRQHLEELRPFSR